MPDRPSIEAQEAAPRSPQERQYMFVRHAIHYAVLVAAFSLPLCAQISGPTMDADSSVSSGNTANTISAMKSTSIFGLVRTLDGKPARDVTVQLNEIQTGRMLRSVTTDVAGQFEFRDLQNGKYEVVAYSGINEARQLVALNALTADVTLQLPYAAAAKGSENATVSVARLKVPDKAEHAFQKAQSLLKAEKLDEARQEALRALQIYPTYADAQTLLGLLDLHANQPEEALKHLEEAVRLDPNSVTAYFMLGSAYNTLNRWDDSLRALDSGERLQPNSWQLQYELARAYLGKDDYAASLRHSTQGLKLAAGEFPALHFLRARALLGLENYPEAVVELENYLSRESNGPNAEEARRSLQQARAWAGQQQPTP